MLENLDSNHVRESKQTWKQIADNVKKCTNSNWILSHILNVSPCMKVETVNDITSFKHFLSFTVWKSIKMTYELIILTSILYDSEGIIGALRYSTGQMSGLHEVWNVCLRKCGTLSKIQIWKISHSLSRSSTWQHGIFGDTLRWVLVHLKGDA